MNSVPRFARRFPDVYTNLGINPYVRTLYPLKGIAERLDRRSGVSTKGKKMKCGHCKGNHDTVAEVRECSGVETVKEFFDSKDSKSRNMLSGKQQGYLRDLLNQFNLALEDGHTAETISYEDGKPILDGLVDARRSKTTGKAFKLPGGVLNNPHKRGPKTRTSTQRVPMPDVPAGYYAVPDWTGHEELKFFRVKRPDKGQWAGRTFVDHIIGGHPDSPCRGAFARKALEAILEFGVEDAGMLYGIRMKQCYSCNRSLTKKASRVLSLGRHCAGKRGRGEEWDAINFKFNDADVDDDDE